MDLSTIKNTGKWDSSAASLNENFSKVGTEVDKLKYAAYNSKLYATEALLKQAVPNPSVGDWAIVGDTIPGEIYQCHTDGMWSATGQTGGGYGMEVIEKNVTEQYVTEVHNEYTGDIVNNPDDEDLISEEKTEGSKVLKLADKLYNASVFSGMGRCYLRKNISGSKNVLTQAMIDKTNTRYIIQYDYDLNGETVTVPEGCTMDFQGGSLANGTLLGNKTKLKGSVSLIQCIGEGVFDIDKVNVRWFGATGDGSDSTDSFNNALTFINKKISYTENPTNVSTLYIPNGIYKINNVKVVNCSITGESSTATIIQSTDDSTDNVTFSHRQTSSYGPKTLISNIYFSTGIFDNRKTSVEFNNCFFGSGSINILQTSDVLISKCIFDQSADGIKIEQCANITISDNIFFNNALRAIWIVSGNGIIVSSNSFNNCWGRPVYIQSGSMISIMGNIFSSTDQEDINDENPAFIKFYHSNNPSYEYPFETVSISNNVFKCHGKYTAIYVYSEKSISGLDISSNDINDAVYGIYAIKGVTRLNIRSNTFSNSLLNNIWANVSNVFIIGNIFINGGSAFSSDTFQSSIMIGIVGGIVMNNVQKYTEDSKIKYWIYLNGATPQSNYSIVINNMLQYYDNKLYIKDVFAETDYSFMGFNYKNMINHLSSFNALGSIKPYPGMQIYIENSAPLYYNNDNWMNEDGSLNSKERIVFSISQISTPNIIYKIVSDIDLGGETLTIPSGCTLDFQGGSIRNGNLILNATRILPYSLKLDDYITAEISGTYKEGQVIYDSSLKIMKLWNGERWCKLDGSNL